MTTTNAPKPTGCQRLGAALLRALRQPLPRHEPQAGEKRRAHRTRHASSATTASTSCCQLQCWCWHATQQLPLGFFSCSGRDRAAGNPCDTAPDRISTAPLHLSSGYTKHTHARAHTHTHMNIRRTNKLLYLSVIKASTQASTQASTGQQEHCTHTCIQSHITCSVQRATTHAHTPCITPTRTHTRTHTPHTYAHIHTRPHTCTRAHTHTHTHTNVVHVLCYFVTYKIVTYKMIYAETTRLRRRSNLTRRKNSRGLEFCNMYLRENDNRTLRLCILDL